MNIQQVSKMTKIPVELLLRMRSRESRSLRSGPPVHKVLTNTGELVYVYLKTEIAKWMKMRNCLITAGDAAELMGISRDEILEIYGLRGFNIKYKGGFVGRLIINNSKNQYIWLPKR